MYCCNSLQNRSAYTVEAGLGRAQQPLQFCADYWPDLGQAPASLFLAVSLSLSRRHLFSPSLSPFPFFAFPLSPRTVSPSLSLSLTLALSFRTNPLLKPGYFAQYDKAQIYGPGWELISDPATGKRLYFDHNANAVYGL